MLFNFNPKTVKIKTRTKVFFKKKGSGRIVLGFKSPARLSLPWFYILTLIPSLPSIRSLKVSSFRALFLRPAAALLPPTGLTLSLSLSLSLFLKLRPAAFFLFLFLRFKVESSSLGCGWFTKFLTDAKGWCSSTLKIKTFWCRFWFFWFLF